MKLEQSYIDDEFDRFFEFPSEDRSQVSSVSAKLFAQHIAYPLTQAIDLMQAEIDVLRKNNSELADQRFDLMNQQAV